MVDAQDLGSCAVRHGGSSPLLGTEKEFPTLELEFLCAGGVAQSAAKGFS